MSKIKAVVVDPDAPNRLVLADVEEAGAHEVVVDESGAAARDRGPYHLVLESVGGEVLGDALSMLAPGGTCVSFGPSASAEVEFEARKFYLMGGALQLHPVPRSAGKAGLGWSRCCLVEVGGFVRVAVLLEEA